MSNLAIRDDSTYGVNTGTGTIAWVKFLSDKAKGGVLSKTQPAGVQTNEFYYEDDLGVVRLDPCKVFVLDLFHHKALLDGEGKMVAAKPIDFDSTGTKYAERTLALVLVQHPAGWQPALIITAKGLCRPWRKAEAVYAKLKDEAILAATPGYEAARDAAHPTGRFTLVLTGGQEKGSAKGAMAYNVGYAAVVPPTPDEVIAFNLFFDSDLRPAVTERYGKEVAAIVAKFAE